MADIAGFKGLLYDASRVELDKVLAPPYDVIDDEGRAQLVARSDKNCVSVILPRSEREGDAKYDEARQLLDRWRQEGVLVRDEAPALYRYHQIFRSQELGDEEVVRRGFIAAVRLCDFEERVIRRHERTLKGPKIDRLKLWEATSTHLSQVFTLYSDPDKQVDAQFAAAESQPPDLDGTSEDGTRHVLWRVSEPEVVARVQKLLSDKNLYIADGHHRYETMLALRNKLLAAQPGAPENSAIRYGMMFLANIDDPGLVVFPTHRMVHSVADFDAGRLRDGLAEFFDIHEVEGAAKSAELLRSELTAAARRGTSFALILPGESTASILTIKSGLDLSAIGVEGSPVTLALDVTLLHSLVLERVLGIDRGAQEAKTNIDYIKDTQRALDQCAAGEGQACFLMNATPVSQVVAVSDADEVMPQKSTFFYPKIASGMVFMPIDPAEVL